MRQTFGNGPVADARPTPNSRAGNARSTDEKLSELWICERILGLEPAEHDLNTAPHVCNQKCARHAQRSTGPCTPDDIQRLRVRSSANRAAPRPRMTTMAKPRSGRPRANARAPPGVAQERKKTH
eukprot:7575244-Alexandrium_andersonii.AAC.1